MSPTRIKAILMQEIYITTHALEAVLDVFFWGVFSIIIAGFVSTFYARDGSPYGYYFLLGSILWEIMRLTQYSISVAVLWNIWSRNLTNIFMSPISLSEYAVALMLSALIKTVIVFILSVSISFFFFHFNIFNLGVVNVLLYFINLLLFGWSLGILLMGVILKFGSRFQALAWYTIYLLQPLTAVFFPLDMLPQFIRNVGYLFPNTYIFESARAHLHNVATDWSSIGMAFGLNIGYFVLAIWLFDIMFKKSKETGQFARNEG